MSIQSLIYFGTSFHCLKTTRLALRSPELRPYPGFVARILIATKLLPINGYYEYHAKVSHHRSQGVNMLAISVSVATVTIDCS